MESKYKSKVKQVTYGFLIDGTKKEDIDNFKKQLVEAHSINFKQDKGIIEIIAFDKIKHELKASSIKVIAIGHGYDNGKINEDYTIIDVVKAVAKELKDCASKVSEFRLQVCHQAKMATTVDEDGKEKLKPDLVAAIKDYKAENVLFCCPRKFSYIKGGSYIDTNAESKEDYNKKSQSNDLKIGKEYSLKKDVVTSKEKGRSV
ncbi:MAG: hypothetical protein FJ368_07270 [Pelagibacterales bacterium]|nr:hypothetical protein [Pelagibacterales bacterium]